MMGGEAHETKAAPRQHGAEDVEGSLLASVDDERLTGGPHSRTPAPVTFTSPSLRFLGD